MTATRIRREAPRPRRKPAPRVRPAPRARARTAEPTLLQQLGAFFGLGTERVQRLTNWLIGGVSVLFLFGLAQLFGVTAMIRHQWHDAVAAAGFEVRQVVLTGTEKMDRATLYSSILSRRDRSMAAIDLDDVRAGLLENGWVADARVSRRLPDTLAIEIVERRPAAVWQMGNRLALVDADGVVLERISPDKMPRLPVLIGPNANLQARALESLLEEAPALQPMLIAANWIGNRRWDLRFESGEILSLPEGERASRRALAEFARMDGTSRLLGRGIVRFDMRDSQRFVLRLPPEGSINRASAEAAGAAHPDIVMPSADEGKASATRDADAAKPEAALDPAAANDVLPVDYTPEPAAKPQTHRPLNESDV